MNGDNGDVLPGKNRNRLNKHLFKRAEANGSKTPSISAAGTGRVILDAVGELNLLVETVHRTIVGPFWKLTPAEGVYRSIQKSTDWLKNSLEAPLQAIDQRLSEECPDTSLNTQIKRETYIAALNGVLGDYLHASENPLSTEMHLVSNRRMFNMTDLDQNVDLSTLFDTELSVHNQIDSQTPTKVIILVHGSCMSEHQWRQQSYDYSSDLINSGYQVLYLRYNSGRHISENGRLFAQLLELMHQRLTQTYLHPPRLSILAHSMGGLVSRSACYYAEQEDFKWIDDLEHLCMLGTPHHGALLERFGNLADNLLELSAYSAPFSRLLKIRSCGVTDLRYGHIIDEDWKGCDRFKIVGDRRTPIALPKHVQCYTLAATLNKQPSNMAQAVVGDGLVSTSSALGQHKSDEMQLNIPEAHQWIGYGLSHNDLLGHHAVGAKLSEWL